MLTSKQLAKLVFDKLINQNLTIGFCESATGGLLSACICQFDNASKIFVGSLITYANDAKVLLANIDKCLINNKGAISDEVSYYMAKAIKDKLNTNIAISVTGNSSESTMMEHKQTCLYYVCFIINESINIYKVKLKPKNNRIFNQQAIVDWIFNKLNMLI